ncbi:MAG TPA: hypothetical protein VGE74_09030 [Gemmata sp.]
MIRARLVAFLLLVVFLPGGLACAPRGEPTRAPDVTVEPPVKRGDVTTDYSELGRWCEAARDQISEAKGTNPIIGSELERSKLSELKTLLVGKTVTWRIKVFAVRPPHAVSLRAIHTTTVKKSGSMQATAGGEVQPSS